MMNIRQLKSEIAQLAQKEVAQLADWLAEFQSGAWDRQIESDSKAGRLDKLIAAARTDFETGRCRPMG
jgi:hypothetical protein